MGIKEIFGIALMVTSVFDAVKYSIQALKVQKLQNASAMSRKFINFALFNDIVKLGYGFVIWDFYIIASSILSLVCMLHLWWMIYWWYPYRMRGCNNFKRPNLMLYIMNSLLPNKIRKRL